MSAPTPPTSTLLDMATASAASDVELASSVNTVDAVKKVDAVKQVDTSNTKRSAADGKASHNANAARLVLEDGYYHQHMQELLHYIQQVQAPLWPDACDATIGRYLGLSQDAQRLWLRLVQRKGPCFMLAQLDYADIGDIHEAWQQLLAVGLLQALSVHRVADYLAQATKSQLQQLWSLLADPILADPTLVDPILADQVLAEQVLTDHVAGTLPTRPKAQAPRAAFYTPLLQAWQQCYALEYQRTVSLDAGGRASGLLAINAPDADRAIASSGCALWLSAIQALHRLPAVKRDDTSSGTTGRHATVNHASPADEEPNDAAFRENACTENAERYVLNAERHALNAERYVLNADSSCWVATVEGRDSLDYLYFLYFGALSAQDKDGKPSATPFTLRDLGIRQVRSNTGANTEAVLVRQHVSSQEERNFRRRFDDSTTARRAFAWAQARQQMFIAAKAWQTRWRALTTSSEHRSDDVEADAGVEAKLVTTGLNTTSTKQAKIQLALQLWPELLAWWQHLRQLAPALEARSERHAQQLWYGLGRWAERCYSELLSDVSTLAAQDMAAQDMAAQHSSAQHMAEQDVATATDTCVLDGQPDTEHYAALALVCYHAAPQWPASERLVRLYDKWRQWPELAATASASPSATAVAAAVTAAVATARHAPDASSPASPDSVASSGVCPPPAVDANAAVTALWQALPQQRIPRGALAQQLMQQLLERMIQSPDCDTELIFAQDIWQRRLARHCGTRHTVLTAMLQQAPCIVLDEVYRQRVEDGVLRYVQPLGYQGFFAENTLWRALFTLILWPVLYHKAELHNDFELRPRSLMQPGFYLQHQAEIEAELAVLQPLTAAGLATLLQRYQAIRAQQTDLVRWPAQFAGWLLLLWYGRWSARALQGFLAQGFSAPDTSALVMSASQGITQAQSASTPVGLVPADTEALTANAGHLTEPSVSDMGAVLATVIRRMAQDFPRNSQGFPDLLLYKELNNPQTTATNQPSDHGPASPPTLWQLSAQLLMHGSEPFIETCAEQFSDDTKGSGADITRCDLEHLTALALAYPAWAAQISSSQVIPQFELQLVEVKAAGDQLRAAQLARLQWFLQLNVAAAVLRVAWGTDPERLYAVVDVETTGGKAEQDRITEIAVVQVRAGKIVGSWSSLVNPERKIPRYIQRLTGITDAMVANAPTFAQLWPEIASNFVDAVFVAHNVNFDYGFVRAEAQRAGQTLMMPRLCTVVQSRRFLPGLSGYGLAALATQLDLPLTQHHRAHADAWATAHLLLKVQAAGGGTELQSGSSSALPSEGQPEP